MLRFCRTAPDIEQSTIRNFARDVGVSTLTAGILLSRGITTPASAEAFFNLRLDMLYNPMLLMDMDKAVALIKRSLSEPICVYGDYDADGISAVTILYNHFTNLGADVRCYIPTRDEGYGVNAAAIREIAGSGVKLLITVDCGITNHKEISLASELGMQVIVTDHHHCLETLPQSAAVIDPARSDDTYPYDKLCGAGVALKLVQALSGTQVLYDYIDVAALATVADIVPLTGENRIIAAEGLKKINSPDVALGIKALIDVSYSNDCIIDSRKLAFEIAPRINAAGRIDDPRLALSLLLSKTYDEALTYAQELNNKNAERKQLESAILRDTLEMVAREDLTTNKMLILSSESWNHGVTGIVASKLAEMFYRPVILFSLDGDVATGSGRSIKGLHLFELLRNFEAMFEKFGGHAQAAGLTIKRENIEPFRCAVNEYIDANIPSELFLPSIDYDLDVTLSDISRDAVCDILRLAPFGVGNPAPVLRAKDVVLEKVAPIGAKGAHLRANVLQNGRSLPAVGFSFGQRSTELSSIKRADILFMPAVNEWRGQSSVQLILRECKALPIENAAGYVKSIGNEFFNAFLSNRKYNGVRLPRITPEKAQAYLNKNIQGTLLLAFTPNGATTALCERDAR
jgi:single-stranded-DNA-specific exonuclease